MKTCATCGQSKPFSEYWVSRKGRTSDGYKGECKECAKAHRRAWAAKNRERESEWNRAKYKADPDYYKARAAEYRSRLAGVFVEKVIPSKVYERDQGVCGICQKPVEDRYDIDHIIPIVKGGMHSYANTQLAHPACNRAKKDRLPWE
jgi:5-methylcytosine-specific restriction endonuclease McrA